MWEKDNLQPGAFVEFKRGIDKGIWKVLEVKKYTDGENTFYRVKIDKDLNTPGNEKIIEWHEMEPVTLYVFDTYDSFDVDDAESWPPPSAILIGEEDSSIEYTSMSEEGFNAIEKTPRENDEDEEREFEHFEYANKNETSFLSIWSVNGTVTMFVGYSIESGFVNLI